MKQIKFYSENDMTVNLTLDTIVQEIENNKGYQNLTISEVLILHNIKKFLNTEWIFTALNSVVSVNLNDYAKAINSSIGKFIHQYKHSFLTLRSQVEHLYSDDFYEVYENYKVYKTTKLEDFIELLNNKEEDLYLILQNKQTVLYFEESIKSIILRTPKYVEVILASYLKDEILYMPIINRTEFEELLIQYINSSEANINVLRKITVLPSNLPHNVSDKIKLMAKKRLLDKEQEVFEGNSTFSTEVLVSFPKNQVEEIIFKSENLNTDIKISWDWLNDNRDYPTLWNNFIHLFNFFDSNLRLNLVSNKKESGVLESLFTPDAPHLYHESTSFLYKEMVYDAIFYSYVNILEVLEIQFEDMINWFFTNYLTEEYGIKDFLISVPSPSLSFFEKCRIIIPEIDKILKQYTLLVEESIIDHELIQISSSSLKIGDVPSMNNNKYYYPESSNTFFNVATNLLFSNQSGIYYRKEDDGKYNNFFELITKETVYLNEFLPFQQAKIEWLFTQDLINISSEGIISLKQPEIVHLLEDLYSHDVVNIFNRSEKYKNIIRSLFEKEVVYSQTTLFSIPEQNYLDYYLNKSRYTNGYDIRNKYMHGTNTNNSKDHEKDYYTILKIIMIIVVKINDDLDINYRGQ